MTTDIQNLINLGLLIVKDEATYTFRLGIDFPKAVIDSGGIDKFAAARGWLPTVVTRDENDNLVTIDNPITEVTYIRSIIRDYVRSSFANGINAKAEADARASVKSLTDLL